MFSFSFCFGIVILGKVRGMYVVQWLEDMDPVLKIF